MDVPVAKTPKKWLLLRSPLAWLMFGLVLVASFLSHALSPALPAVSQQDLWINEVKRGDFTRKVRGVGVLVPSEVRWVAATSPGRVERLLVKPGAVVDVDTIIAEMSNPDLISELERAMWELDAAEANLMALEAQLQEQTLDHELQVTRAQMALETAVLKQRAEQPLADQNIISALDFETTKLNARQKQTELEIRRQAQKRGKDVEQAKLAAEQAKVRRYRNMVSYYEAQVAALRVTAGTSGVLQEIAIDVGERVEVGINIARVAAPDSLLAELQIQENLVEAVKIGFPVVVDTRNGLVDGIVKRIDPRVLNGNVQIDVELTSELPDSARPDLNITGTILAEEIKDTLYVDRPSGVAQLSEAKLFVLDETRAVAELTPVRFGQGSVSAIQILGGLEAGDALIVSDLSDFSEHTAISITP